MGLRAQSYALAYINFYSALGLPNNFIFKWKCFSSNLSINVKKMEIVLHNLKRIFEIKFYNFLYNWTIFYEKFANLKVILIAVFKRAYKY